MAGPAHHRSSPPPLAYRVVTAVVWGLYAGLVLLAGQVLPVHSPLAVAVVTLAAAAALSPPRRWIQRMAKRRFARR